jgi:hypothetical protein
MKKTPKRKSLKRCYLVLSKKKKHRYGAFPYTKEGYKRAEEYVKTLKKEHKEDFIVQES